MKFYFTYTVNDFSSTFDEVVIAKNFTDLKKQAIKRIMDNPQITDFIATYEKILNSDIPIHENRIISFYC